MATSTPAPSNFKHHLRKMDKDLQTLLDKLIQFRDERDWAQFGVTIEK